MVGRGSSGNGGEESLTGRAAIGYDHGYDGEVFYLGLALDPHYVDGWVEGCLLRVAMRMGCMASWTDESLFQRPPSEDRGCHRTRNAQGPGRSHLRSRDLHRQALRHQGPKRRIS